MIAETVCSAVAAAGLGIAVVAAYRKRYLTATRIAAYALVPLGLVMTGVVEWLADTAFSPTAWAGFGVLGLSWLLFATTRTVEQPARRHPQGAQGGPGSGTGDERPRRHGTGRVRTRPRTGRLPRAEPGTPAEAGRAGRRRLQRHRGHPQEARHMNARDHMRHSRPRTARKRSRPDR